MERCDDCGINAATIHVTQISGNASQIYHFCEECARKRGIHVSIDEMAALVQSPHSIPNVEERKCACCHLKLSSFTSKGRLGCPSCYQAFEKEVEELLQHLHGTTEHRGKQYQAGAGSRVAQGDLSQLTVELDSAIKNEEFERAALLRDAIHGLKNTEGK